MQARRGPMSPHVETETQVYHVGEPLKNLVVEGRQPGFHTTSPLQGEGTGAPRGSLVFYDKDAADRYYKWLHRDDE